MTSAGVEPAWSRVVEPPGDVRDRHGRVIRYEKWGTTYNDRPKPADLLYEIDKDRRQRYGFSPAHRRSSSLFPGVLSMNKTLGFVGLLALVGCNGAPPAPDHATPPTVVSTPGEIDGWAYILLVPNMT
jgi:hypothetical protein